MLEFDEKGRMGFSDISQALKSHGINESKNIMKTYTCVAFLLMDVYCVLIKK